MSENLKAFLESAKGDPELCRRLAGMDAGELVAAARERGFEITEADLRPPTGEVGDEELGNVAGGGGFCFAFGYGDGENASDGSAWQCMCPVVGDGEANDESSAEALGRNCLCAILGWGTTS